MTPHLRTSVPKRSVLFLAIAAWLALAGLAAAAPLSDGADPVRFPAVSMAAPGGRVLLYFEVKNSSAVTWAPGSVVLRNVKNPMGAPSQFNINRNVLPNETAYWDFEAAAPGVPGIYESAWQVARDGTAISPVMSCYVVAVPKEAQALREKIQQLIDDFNRQQGHEIGQLIRQIGDLFAKEGKGLIQRLIDTRCGLASGMLAVLAVTVTIRRRKLP